MSKKNIVLIMSDEQRWDTTGFAGNTAAKTPFLDALADEGIVMQNCYTPYPLCCPARTSLWTGMMPRNHHTWGNWRAVRPELRDGTLVKAFGRNDYHTVYVGKWHVPGTTPERMGFKDSAAIPAVLKGRDRGRFIPDYREYARNKGYPLLEDHIENLTQNDLEQLQQPGKAPYGTASIPYEHFLEKWQTDQLLETLDRRPQDKPFFAVCSYNAPHFPMIVPEPFDKLIDPDSIPLPANFCRGIDGKPDEVILSNYFQDYKNYSEEEWRRMIAHYYGLCSLVDEQVGRIVQYLKENGELDNTIIVFVSDHGDMMGAHGLMEKGHALHYEETLKVPLLFWNPDLRERQSKEQLVSLVDLLPTLADLVGVDIESEVDGRSFASILSQHEQGHTREHIIAETFRLAEEQSGHRGGGDGKYVPIEQLDMCGSKDQMNISIRSVNEKYIFRWNGEDEYYNLSEDPYENINLINSKEDALSISDLQEILINEYKEIMPKVSHRIMERKNSLNR